MPKSDISDMPDVVWVKVTTELIPYLNEWTPPLHIRVQPEDDGSHTMIFKTPEWTHENV